MPRRWTTTITAFLAILALACEGSGGSGGSSPASSTPSHPGRTTTIVALGDSITAGFGSCLSLAACQRNSWSTGDGLRVNSLYRRLLESDPTIRGNAHNQAVAGARVAALTDQAAGAVRAKADYVTVLIGANDVCRSRVEEMTSVADFRAGLDRALAVLRDKLPRARVFVVSIPDLHRLWAVGHTDSRAVRIWSHGICPALLANAASMADADVTRRSAFQARVKAYNGELAAACRAYGSRCRYDGGAAHRVRFSLNMVNRLDYFHPNVDGQNKLAEVAWAASGLAGRAG